MATASLAATSKENSDHPVQQGEQKLLPAPILLTARQRNASKSKRTATEVELALREAHGYISTAAQMLRITQRALRDRIQRNVDLKRLLFDIRETQLDHAESKLGELVDEKNLGAIIWTLKCQGRHRGWIERPEESPPPPVEPDREPVLIINFVTPQPRKLPNESVPAIRGTLIEG